MRVLLAHDFSALGESALEWINTHLREEDLQVVVLYASPPTPAVPYGGGGVGMNVGTMTDERRALEEFIEGAEKVRGATYRPLVAYGPAADAILSTAIEETVDLIVMGSHGRKGIKHLVLGSVAERVVREAKIPVVVVKQETV